LPYSSVSSSARFPDLDQHRLQVIEVEEEQPLPVGKPEGDGEHAFLSPR
jgi:hypothetical protein